MLRLLSGFGTVCAVGLIGVAAFQSCEPEEYRVNVTVTGESIRPHGPYDHEEWWINYRLANGETERSVVMLRFNCSGHLSTYEHREIRPGEVMTGRLRVDKPWGDEKFMPEFCEAEYETARAL